MWGGGFNIDMCKITLQDISTINKNNRIHNTVLDIDDMYARLYKNNKDKSIEELSEERNHVKEYVLELLKLIWLEDNQHLQISYKKL